MSASGYQASRYRSRRFTAALVVLCLLVLPLSSSAEDRIARIGVLAYRGVDAVAPRWQPLVDYLDAEIEGWRFELVPVTLVTSAELLTSRKLDFLITNPGHFVSLEERFGLSAIATRERRSEGDKSILHFGTVVLVRADRTDLQTLADLKGKTLVAVSPEAFGGFQMAWYEFHLQGIDLFRDLAGIRYIGFPQDSIVTSVLSGQADAGVVRSGLIEAMIAERRLKAGDVRALLDNTQVEHPYVVSSRLYPEWAFAMHSATDRRLAETVAMALLKTQTPGTANRFGLTDLWSAPMSYEGVRSVLNAYRRHTGEAAVNNSTGNWLLLAAGMIAAILAAFMAGRTYGRAHRHEHPETTILQARRARFDELTQREREILSRLCKGERTKQIADALHISPRTVEYHRMNLLQKTGTRSTPRMVRMATQIGFDRLPETGEKPVKAP